MGCSANAARGGERSVLVAVEGVKPSLKVVAVNAETGVYLSLSLRDHRRLPLDAIGACSLRFGLFGRQGLRLGCGRVHAGRLRPKPGLFHPLNLPRQRPSRPALIIARMDHV